MDHRYRYVNDWQRLASHNGLGVHQRIWEQYGAKCFAPLRLSHRLKNVDVIVLAASTFGPTWTGGSAVAGAMVAQRPVEK